DPCARIHDGRTDDALRRVARERLRYRSRCDVARRQLPLPLHPAGQPGRAKESGIRHLVAQEHRHRQRHEMPDSAFFRPSGLACRMKWKRKLSTSHVASGSVPYWPTSHSAKRVVNSAVVYSRAWMAAMTTMFGLLGSAASVAVLLMRSTRMRWPLAPPVFCHVQVGPMSITRAIVGRSAT